MNAKAGQKAEFHLSSVEHNALFTVYLPGAALKKGDGGIDVEGETLPGANVDTGASQWSGVLPKDGQYIIAVAPTRGGATCKLAVAIKRNRTIVFENFGRTVLYTLAELEAGDRRNLVICRSSKILNGNELGQRNDHESSSKPPIGSWVVSRR